MRVTHAVVAALAVAVAAGLAGPTALANGSAGAATSRAKTVAVSPSPGDRFASPQTTISFRGVTPAALGTVRVTGARSGVHPGRLVADPRRATIWKPRAPFAPGERVTVHTSVTIAGAGGHNFYFTVARIAPHAPEVLPPDSGTGPRTTVSASATPPGPWRPFTDASGGRHLQAGPALVSQRTGPAPSGVLCQSGRDRDRSWVAVAPPQGHRSRGNGTAIVNDRGNLIWTTR